MKKRPGMGLVYGLMASTDHPPRPAWMQERALLPKRPPTKSGRPYEGPRL